MMVSILFSGFGGQGMMSLGKILARVCVEQGKHATWFPSYGAEMRGGTAHCYVRISNKEIASPLVENPDIAVIMNQPSLAKFEKKIKKGGLIVLNADLAKIPSRKDIKKLTFHLNNIARDTAGNILHANAVALGVLVKANPKLFKRETVIRVLKEVFKNKKEMFEKNLKAFEKGESLV